MYNNNNIDLIDIKKKTDWNETFCSGQKNLLYNIRRMNKRLMCQNELTRSKITNALIFIIIYV